MFLRCNFENGFCEWTQSGNSNKYIKSFLKALKA